MGVCTFNRGSQVLVKNNSRFLEGLGTLKWEIYLTKEVPVRTIQLTITGRSSFKFFDTLSYRFPFVYFFLFPSHLTLSFRLFRFIT